MVDLASTNKALQISDSVDRLIEIFDECFAMSFNTRLIRGEEEPIYRVATEQSPYHQVVFAHGYFSSALHEIAHWCIAGDARRAIDDYGYWYAPDGRTVEQQKAFEKVEIKPQALEWIFSVAAGIRFRISVDNLSGEDTDTAPFMNSVLNQVVQYCDDGLPKRAEQFRQVLAEQFSENKPLDQREFQLADLML